MIHHILSDADIRVFVIFVIPPPPPQYHFWIVRLDCPRIHIHIMLFHLSLDLLLIFDPNLWLLGDIALNASLQLLPAQAFIIGLKSTQNIVFKGGKKMIHKPSPTKACFWGNNWLPWYYEGSNHILSFSFGFEDWLFVQYQPKETTLTWRQKVEVKLDEKEKNVLALQMQVSFQKCESKVGSRSLQQKGCKDADRPQSKSCPVHKQYFTLVINFLRCCFS